MTAKKVGNGIWRSSLDKYQEASFYAQQARKPDGGISARQIKASLQRTSESEKTQKSEDKDAQAK